MTSIWLQYQSNIFIHGQNYWVREKPQLSLNKHIRKRNENKQKITATMQTNIYCVIIIANNQKSHKESLADFFPWNSCEI